MKDLLRHPVRLAGRALWLAGELSLAALGFVALVGARSSLHLTLRRARWAQRSARRLLKVFGVNLTVRGAVPREGLLVANHLSYLDILVIGSLTPSVFVAKREVRGWPVFGWLAHQAGTLFIERTKRSDVARVNAQVARLLEAGVLLVIFPEGTSSDGREVLPFKSSLLEPVVGQGHPLAAGYLGYTLEEGEAGREVCYWGDMTLGPHLLKLLTKRRVRASIAFSQVEASPECRKELARLLHAEVQRLSQREVAAVAVAASPT
jgi:1-acyl-sn-glycerol-3-phosphate acyltransferase